MTSPGGFEVTPLNIDGQARDLSRAVDCGPGGAQLADGEIAAQGLDVPARPAARCVPFAPPSKAVAAVPEPPSVGTLRIGSSSALRVARTFLTRSIPPISGMSMSETMSSISGLEAIWASASTPLLASRTSSSLIPA